MPKILKIEYIEIQMRDKLPKPQNPIDKTQQEINLFYSETISNLHRIIPETMERFDAWGTDYSAKWLSLGETVMQHIEGCIDSYDIDHENLFYVTNDEGEITGQSDEDTYWEQEGPEAWEKFREENNLPETKWESGKGLTLEVTGK